MGDKGKKPGYRQTVRRLLEERAAPPGMRLEPQLELKGSREIMIWRHGGILEYDTQRVLVISQGFLYEVEGEGLVLTAMSRDVVGIRGDIAGVRLVGGQG